MTSFSWLQEYIMSFGGGGIIVERWVQECVAQMGRIFGFSDLQMVPFYLKIGLDIGRVFAKCLIFDEFFLWLTYRLWKSTYASQFTWLKVLICLKKGPSRNKWFRHRLQIFVFSGLVIGWWLKRWAGLPYPTQIWVPRPPPPPPPEWACHNRPLRRV